MMRRSLTDRILLAFTQVYAGRHWRRLVAGVRDAVRTQERVLLEKVRRNVDSAFGRDFGLAGVDGYRAFAERVPILRYEDLAPYVERVMAGDVAAMFGASQGSGATKHRRAGRQPVRMFAMTSGTADRPKYVPVTDAFLYDCHAGWQAFGIKAMRDHPGTFLRPIVRMSSPMDEHYTAAGVACGAISGLMAEAQTRLVRRYYVVPAEVGRIPDATARYYCAMRFAVPAQPAFCVTASPATQLGLARTADRFAADLIRDIRDGTLSQVVDVPDEIRAGLTGRLRADPRAAAALDQVAQRTGRLLPKNYWQLNFLANWTGGTMGLYLHDFPEYFGETPVRDIGLLASEGRISVPIEDGTAAGWLDVVGNFFEFVPVEEADGSGGAAGAARRAGTTVLRCHELEVGREYFVLLTTAAGFYRYDIGDVVRVVDYCGATPIIEFLHKGAHTCSLAGEKLNERQVILAVERVRTTSFKLQASSFKPQALGRTSVAGSSELDGTSKLEARSLRLEALFVLAPRWGQPPGYRLYLENIGRQAADDWAARVDRALAEINVEYAGKRASGRLAGIEACRLPSGTLARFDAKLAGRHRRANEQFKHRYLMTRLDEDQALAQLAICEGAPNREQIAVGEPN